MESREYETGELNDLELEAVTAGKEYNVYGRRPGAYRPGLGYGGVGGPWSGLGVRPGAGWGAPGLGMRRGWG